MSAIDHQVERHGERVADAGAFADVFRSYYGPLVRYARTITRDAAAAGDVVQDVFLKLWEDRERLVVTTSIRSMLYTMVRNRALNTHRRDRYRANGIGADDLDGARAGSESGDAAVSLHELKQNLSRWIQALPERRREAFVLSRYHDLPHVEIAAIMGISPRTVDTHILLALRELRRRLDKIEHEGAES